MMEINEAITEIRLASIVGHDCGNPDCWVNNVIAIFREIEDNEDAIQALGSLVFVIRTIRRSIRGFINFQGDKEKASEGAMRLLRKMAENYESDKDPEGILGLGVILLQAIGENEEVIKHLGNLMSYTLALRIISRDLSRLGLRF